MFYQLLFGVLPWTGKSPADLLENIKMKPLKFPDTVNVTQDTKFLIGRMLRKEEEDRIEWHELFTHEYFK